MKDVAASSHNLRRPSFANTLAELPEVEETGQDGGRSETVENGRMVKESHAQLPAIAHGSSGEFPSLKYRQRLNSLPERLPKNSVTPKSKNDLRRRASSETPLQDAVPSHASLQGKGKENVTSHSNHITKKQTHNGSVTPSPQQSTKHVSRYTMPRMSTDFNPARRSSSLSDNVISRQYLWNKEPKPVFRRYSHGHATDSDRKKGALAIPFGVSQRITAPKSILSQNGWASSSPEPKHNSIVKSQGGRHDSRENVSPERDESMFSEAMLSKRRWSRPSFAITSRRVSLLLKSSNAMRGEKKKDRYSSEKITPTITVPDELPKQPRFSTFMSAEAQYALMKGYEDIIHDKLSSKYPEYGGMLKRNKTPVQKINIRRKSLMNGLEDAAEEDESEEEEEEEAEDVFTGRTSDLQHGNVNGHNLGMPAADSHRLTSHYVNTLGVSKDRSMVLLSPTSSETSITSIYLQSPAGPRDGYASSIISEPPKATSTAALKSLRRLSYSLHGSDPRKLFDDEPEDETNGGFFPLQRYNSLPAVCTVSNDRRLVLTHRLESAMDMLDAMKGQGEMSLSPRVKVHPRQLGPLIDYNNWANNWSREFRISPTKA